MPRIKPGGAVWEAQTLPLSYDPKGPISTYEGTAVNELLLDDERRGSDDLVLVGVDDDGREVGAVAVLHRREPLWLTNEPIVKFLM